MSERDSSARDSFPDQAGGSTALRLKADDAAPASSSEEDLDFRPTEPDSVHGPILAQPGQPAAAASSDPAVTTSLAQSSWAKALLGQVLDGRYEVEALIGEGAMGVVYRARHKLIDKVVAIKVLRKDMAGDTEVIDRFVIEAKAASAAGSPHIVDTIDFGTLADGSIYSVMEHLEGRTVGATMMLGALSVEQILRIGKQMAEGLGDAHDAGIVHRDLKPDNVFITRRSRDREFIKILDFGIAKVASSQKKLTRAGAIFGTPYYMSPEQAAGKPVDHRTDIYSLGAVLYEMATGRVPFDAEAPMSILHMHIHDEPLPPRDVPSLPRPVPESLEAIILKCMAKDPEHRYQSMAEVAIELEKASGGITPDAVREIAWRVRRKGKGLKRAAVRRPFVASALALLALTAAAAIYVNRAPRLGDLVRPVRPIVVGAALQEAEQESSPAPLKGGFREVAVLVSPVDAEVLMGDANLGMMPVTVRIKEGEKALLRVVRNGFYQRNVEIDGSHARVVVKLVPVVPGKDAPVAPNAQPGSIPGLLPEPNPSKPVAPPASAVAPPADTPPAPAPEAKPAASAAAEPAPKKSEPVVAPPEPGPPIPDLPPAKKPETDSSQ